MTDPISEIPEDDIEATAAETATFDDHTEASDDDTPPPSPIEGVRTP